MNIPDQTGGMPHHFIITMAFGATQFGWDGTYTLAPGETRAEAYKAIVEKTKRIAASGGVATTRHATLFFSFEPNEIQPATAAQRGATDD